MRAALDCSDEPGNIFFLFKAQCPVIATHIGLPLGTHVLTLVTGNGLFRPAGANRPTYHFAKTATREATP